VVVAKAALAPIVDTVAVAVAVPFATEIAPTEHVGAGLTAGATVHVRATEAGLNPFNGVMVMLDEADWPGVTVEGDNAEAPREKSVVTLATLDVLPLKSPSPA